MLDQQSQTRRGLVLDDGKLAENTSTRIVDSTNTAVESSQTLIR